MHYYLRLIYILGLAGILFFLPITKIGISISAFVMLGAWIVAGAWKEKLRLITTNIPLVSIAGLYLLFVIGMIHTHNWEHGLQDLRIKLPMLMLPIVMGSSEGLSNKERNGVLGAFVVSILLCVVYSLGIYYQGNWKDIRNIVPPQISHIHFSYMVILSMYIGFYFIFNVVKNNYFNAVIGSIILFFTYYLFILQSFNGMIVFLGSIAMWLCYQALKRPAWRIGLLTIVGLGIGSLGYLFYQEQQTFVPKDDLTQLKKYTANGRLYTHEMDYLVLENNHYLHINTCPEELEKQWNKQSTIQYNEKDKRGEVLWGTLLRYMNSKGYTKDSAGVKMLTKEDIQYIENGVANPVLLTKNPISKRINQFLFEYKNRNYFVTLNGSSLLLKLELWKAATDIWLKNFWVGVGTGDSKDAFQEYYAHKETKLDKQWQLTGHNQYLEYAVQIGIIGLLAGIFVPLYAFYKRKILHHSMVLLFISMEYAAMITENIFDTQAALTLFIGFNCLFLSIKEYGSPSNVMFYNLDCNYK